MSWLKAWLKEDVLSPAVDLFSLHRKKENSLQRIFNGNYEPGVGALIYCELFSAEHSGIYLGNREIAQLNGDGLIEIVSPSQFTSSYLTNDRDIFIPMLGKNNPAKLPAAATRARRQIGQTRDYHVILENCHQFCSGCITGSFINAYNFLALSKLMFQIELNHKVYWQRWDYQKPPTFVKLKR